MTINGLTGSSYFYWLFEAIKGNIFNDKLPLLIYFEGGPGCSGEFGMFYDNIAPFLINNNSQPYANPYTWTSDFHVMTIDYPLGVGFSTANAGYDIKNTTSTGAAQIYNFLLKMVQKYPNWFNRDIYIWGESYAGHWVAGIAYKILSENRSPSPQYRFNLKGVGIGDPWIDPPTQTQYFSEFSYQTGLINQDEYKLIKSTEQDVIQNLNSGNVQEAYNNYQKSFRLVSTYAGGANIYNMRNYAADIDLGQFPNWLNLNTTKQMLNINQNQIWYNCNGDIGTAVIPDQMSSTIAYYPYILDSIKVLIYSGQDDLLVNTISTEEMLGTLNWPYTEDFVNSYKVIYKVNGQVAGYAKSYNNLNFVVMLKSGHFVPHDQPSNTRDMIYRFIYNQGWQ